MASFCLVGTAVVFWISLRHYKFNYRDRLIINIYNTTLSIIYDQNRNKDPSEGPDSTAHIRYETSSRLLTASVQNYFLLQWSKKLLGYW